MDVKFEKFESGWIGISCPFGTDEIDLVVARLIALRAGKIGHFHFRTDVFSHAEGIADIEFSMKGKDDLDNMSIK